MWVCLMLRRHVISYQDMPNTLRSDLLVINGQ